MRNLKKLYLAVLLAVLLILFAATSLRLPNAGASAQSQTLYTGYQVTGPYSTLRVEGSWIVPSADCKLTPNSVSNISVIIDGISGEGDAMEIGTYQDCTNGVASYGAFVHIYPMTEYYGETGGNISDIAIHPGDVVEAQGTWRPADVPPINWNTNFIDETTSAAVDTDAETNSTFSPVLNSGAIILSSDGHTLTALNPIESGVSYTDVKFSDITGAQRASSTFGETGATSGYSLVTWQMPGTSLGALSDSGSSFQITSSMYTLTSVHTNAQSPNTLLPFTTLILVAAVALALIVVVAAIQYSRRK